MTISRPLKTQWFHILLALAERDRHGYGIQRAVLQQTEGQVRLWPAMLYRSLSLLTDEGMVSVVDAPADEPEDGRRLYYSLTSKGKKLLQAEAEVLAQWAEAARAVS